MRSLCIGILLVPASGMSAPAASPATSAGASVEWGSKETPAETSGESQTQVFQLSINYGMGSLTLEANGERTLPKAASPVTYEDGQPVSGTYANGSVKQLRTVASMLLPFRGRSFVLGIGLEDLDVGVAGSSLSKAGGTEGSFHMNSLILEAGALRNFNRWGQALVTMSYDHALGGKLRSRYITKSIRSDAAQNYAIVNDSLVSGGRLSITGNYQFNLLPGFSFGIFTSAQYGSIAFVDRNQRSFIYGYTTGLSLMLKI
ncbi:hypothetical protein [Oligoflexus tunisiensis]|uniref:hypothetical protein n=1 Tax=Oligoflexus tunisiensis TaxID=708132 RepID=UPI00114CB0CB|nr:hypothetical protein [Oligoflexus tunisiensis]